ncbi:MAG TPA: DUF975 family protein [Candidatus Izemoplasmatales bacterium]|nr:DUF975 family protein [Candidatus Izemoplasmatales bacterium]
MNPIKSNQEYRDLAVQILNGRYKPVIIVLLVVWLVTGALTSTLSTGNAASSLAQLVSLAISAGISYSMVGVWRGELEKKDPDLKETLLSGFQNDFVRNLLLYFLTSLFTFLWALLLIVPGIVKAYSYSMGFYLIHRDPALKAEAAIKESMVLTNGKKMQLFTLDLSYLGWYFIGIFTLGILWLWVYPKHQVARMALFEDIYLAAHPIQSVEA